ncbi:MAG: hypothetical protein ABIT58_03335 [Ferruginibacter sp.]
MLRLKSTKRLDEKPNAEITPDREQKMPEDLKKSNRQLKIGNETMLRKMSAPEVAMQLLALRHGKECLENMRSSIHVQPFQLQQLSP